MATHQSSGNNSDSDDLEPVVTLKNGVDIEDLVNGTEFEVNLDDIEKSVAGDEMCQYDSSHIYKFYKEDVLDKDDQNEDDDDDLTPFESMARKMENLTPDGGIKKQILHQGVGSIVSSGAHVTVHYNGYLEYADEPFDSSRLRQTPLSFDLGSGEVLPGFDLAVCSMRKKELARFLIGPAYGLGEHGCPPRIPGNSTCLYVIELLNFDDFGGVGDYFSMPMSERNDAPFDLVLKAVKKTKQEAKSHFESQRYHPASGAYRRAINILEPYHLKNDEEEEKQKQVLLQLYTNLALCCLKLGQCGKVIRNANEALGINPNSYKAMYMKGKALRQQGEFDRAKEMMLKARSLCPKSKEIIEELKKIQKNDELFHFEEKKLYQKMFGQKPDESSAQDGSNNDASKNVSSKLVNDEISKMFREKLQMFAEDPELMEFPFSSASHTLEELDSLESIAKDLGLLVLRKHQARNVHIRVCKPNKSA